MIQPPTTPSPTIGAALLLANGNRGWDPQALLLPSPLVLLRFRDGVCRVFAAGAEQPFLVATREPLGLIEEILGAMRRHVPKPGPKAPKPGFPLAVIAAAYEFGRQFDPHQHCFPHAAALEHDELVASFFIDAYRPDSQGGTERIGYSGNLPVGWMEGAPALSTGPYGHEAPPVIAHPVASGVAPAPLAPQWDAARHAAAVGRIAGWLAAGDIYQANLTLPLEGTTAAAPEELFDRALARGGAAFAGLLVLPEATLLSLSPELYLRRRGLEIQTRPIKGTRPIPRHLGGVSQAREELLSSTKDRAEHIMIVDLERNDLGRLCQPGTVEADPLAEVVEHPTVLHLESTVRGRLRPGTTLHDLFAATFPGGSVTGAPKRRAMEIIGAVESGPRGFYCGAFGWVDADGDVELNLPIRTALITPDGRVRYHAGGGVVADSTPEREWEEIREKAAFFSSLLDSAAGRA